MNKKKTIVALFFCLVFVGTAFSFDRVVNYSAVNCVNAFALDGNTLWVGTTGGLYSYNRTSGTGTLYSDPVLFPDPNITALCIDANHTIWAGTSTGYLYKRPVSGRQTMVNSYFMAGWQITALDTAGGFLIVGTNTGCSLFDMNKLIALKNSAGFAPGFPTQVNTIAIFRDTLLLGTGRGMVKLFADNGKSLVDKLSIANFYDRTIWSIDSSFSTAINSIVVQPNGYQALSAPSAMFQNRMVSGDSLTLLADTQKITTFPSNVTTLCTDNNKACFVGTSKSCFFIWDGSNAPRAVTITGPVFSTVNNVFVDRESVVWVSPTVSGASPSFSWDGYSAFRNGSWLLYDPVHFPAVGWMGQDINKGAAEDRFGRVWLGSRGGSVKRYDRSNNSWLKYCIYASNQGAQFESNLNGACETNWAMSDAITVDSSGYLWITCWNNFAGSLICYDPRFDPVPYAQGYENAHYRRFWDENDPFFAKGSVNDITVINTDIDNNIFVGYSNGQIVIFRHDGNPLKDSIRVTNVFNKSGSVYAAVSTPDSLTRIACGSSLYTYDPRSNQLLNGLCLVAPSSSGAQITVVDSTLKNITALAAEDEKVLWLGTSDSGVIRYDLANSSKTIVNETQGLLSNSINSLSLDRKNGFLWIASVRGVSRYSIGYQIGVVNKGPPTVYPNPYSKRRHNEMVFQNLPPGSNVNVYTVSGSLLAALSPQDSSNYGSFCVWKPSGAIAPGVYRFIVNSKTKSSQGRVIITP